MLLLHDTASKVVIVTKNGIIVRWSWMIPREEYGR